LGRKVLIGDLPTKWFRCTSTTIGNPVPDNTRFQGDVIIASYDDGVPPVSSSYRVHCMITGNVEFDGPVDSALSLHKPDVGISAVSYLPVEDEKTHVAVSVDETDSVFDLVGIGVRPFDHIGDDRVSTPSVSGVTLVKGKAG